MKNLLIIFLLVLSNQLVAQTYKFYQTDNIHNKLRLNSKTGEVYQIQNDGQKYLVHWAVTPDSEKMGRYVLRKTENMWTYILLDRFTGRLWQCQYSVKGTDYITSWTINTNDLSSSENDVFTIEPLTSMFQFYLINQTNGDMWKFQWTTKKKEGYRWIERI